LVAHWFSSWNVIFSEKDERIKKLPPKVQGPLWQVFMNMFKDLTQKKVTIPSKTSFTRCNINCFWTLFKSGVHIMHYHTITYYLSTLSLPRPSFLCHCCVRCTVQQVLKR
jgi:hypothetical protein